MTAQVLDQLERWIEDHRGTLFAAGGVVFVVLTVVAFVLLPLLARQ